MRGINLTVPHYEPCYFTLYHHHQITTNTATSHDHTMDCTFISSFIFSWVDKGAVFQWSGLVRYTDPLIINSWIGLCHAFLATNLKLECRHFVMTTSDYCYLTIYDVSILIISLLSLI